MNTANLQLEGLIMAVAAISDALTEKGLLNHRDVAAALGRAEKAASEDRLQGLSEANQAAVLFPIRVLTLANEASQRGRTFTFAEYAELVGKLT
ncbi:hypothetical protein JNB88_31250 [Rhizobium cauense]|uniref:hypothetical protein n=1 Tax=Rhizobium cauense TaxID=1166683 RepID=UPI001C6E961C|nr:hypothetical protein [Rhizobium cauense]MBW9118092.1 hypothetical protein [Rhizobium cauense]